MRVGLLGCPPEPVDVDCQISQSRSGNRARSEFMRRPFVLPLLIAALIGAATAACGTRGSLESPKAEGNADETATADSGQGKKEGQAPKPHRDFVLDGLIR
jgi:predicted small lipoprotein YifL